MSYSVLLENPRRRRRSRRKASRRRSRRRNPMPFASNPPRRRRRRRSGKRRSSGRGRRRSNPFRLPLIGNIGGGVIGQGVQLHLAEFGVQIAERAAAMIPGADRLNNGWKRIALGLTMPWLMRKLRVPSGFANTFGAVAIAQGLYFFTTSIRANVLGRIGLNDYVTSLDGIEEDDGELSEAGYGLLGLGQPDDIEPDGSGALNDYVTEFA